jgi:hypothetical protein
MPLILETEIGGSWLKASQGKLNLRAYLKSKLKPKGLGV